MFRQVQAAGDLQGARLADVADVQPVARPERLQVEFDGGVLGPRVRERIGLQVADVAS